MNAHECEKTKIIEEGEPEKVETLIGLVESRSNNLVEGDKSIGRERSICTFARNVCIPVNNRMR